MEDLPFAAVHGGRIWLAALAFAVVAMPAFAAAARSAREALRARRLRGEVAWTHTGTIRVRGAERVAAASEFLRMGSLGLGLPALEEVGVWERARDVVLETADGRIAIAGPIEVRLGSRQSWRDGIEVRSIRGGDRVRAVGDLLRRACGASAGGYRDDVGEWAMESVVVAFEGTPEGPVRRSALRGLACGLAAWVAVFVVGGEVAILSLETVYGAEWPLALHVAAISPVHRDDALAEMAEVLGRRPHDWVEQEMLVEVETLRGRRGEAIQHLFLEGETRRALLFLEENRDEASRVAAAAWRYAIGDFERASDAYRWIVRTNPRFSARLEPRVHLLAGRPEVAAAAARRAERHATSEREAAIERAVALAIEAREGDAGARAALEADRDAPEAVRAVLLADLASRRERLRILEGRQDALSWWLRFEADPLGEAPEFEAGRPVGDRQAAIRRSAWIALARLPPMEPRAKDLAERLRAECERFDRILWGPEDGAPSPSRHAGGNLAGLPRDFPLMASRIGLIGPQPVREAPIVERVESPRASALRPFGPEPYAEVRRWIRGGRLGWCLDCPTWRLLDDLVERRDEAGGDSETRERLGDLGRTIAAFGDAILRRDTAVPLAVLEDLELSYSPGGVQPPPSKSR